MSAKNFRLLLPALALACMATFAFADEGQGRRSMSLTGCPWSRIMWITWAYCPGPWCPHDNGRHEGWYKDKPRPKGHYKRGPSRTSPRVPSPRRPSWPRPGYHRPGDRPGPRPGIHDGRGPRHDGPRPGPRPGGPAARSSA